MHAQEVAQEVLAKPAQEVKVLGFCSLPARTFETQEVENLSARKLLMLPQAARRRKKY